MFFVLKRKTMYILLVCAFSISALCIYSACKTEFVSASPKRNITVVIDAGHGGVDGGSTGRFTGVTESNLNLIYAKNLKAKLIDYGYTVVMTREDGDGLYDPTASNLKKSDMKKRKEIIEKADADVLISIHMNSYSLASSRGAQVFFSKGNEYGEKLATAVQSQFRAILNNTTKQAKSGDYYIVNCTPRAGCLIECGFISNKEEELLLQQKAYQDKLCYAIVCGIIDYLGVEY